MADVSSPKTPTNVQRIPKDDSFKTCKASMSSPNTRRNLRMTPARTSILSGGKPFKETPTSGKKFNARRTKAPNGDLRPIDDTSNENDNEAATTTAAGLNDSVGSNGTYIMFEQGQKMAARKSSTPKKISPKEMAMRQKVSPKKMPPKRASPKKMSPRKISPRKFPPKKTIMPPPPAPLNSNVVGSAIKRKFVTPRIAYKKPASLMGTASRYLSQWNTSRITRTSSFKSTAEMERDYFKSLRSF